MKCVLLTQGKVAFVDDEDYAEISKHNWYATKNHHWYAGRWGPQGRIYMHRVIIMAKPGQQVDHINGNTLDNRRANLRMCNNSQNQQNRKACIKGSSRYRGVSFRKEYNRWYAGIKVYGKSIYLGSYCSEVEAARKYNEAAKHYFGSFANLNTVPAGDAEEELLDGDSDA